MNDELRRIWEKEESIARIEGWDFSHIHERYEEENALPWDYETIIHEVLRDDMKLLDYDTGGGEFLLSLHHPYGNTAATEGYPPNVEYCRKKLLPLGKYFVQSGRNMQHKSLKMQRFLVKLWFKMVLI